MSWRKADTATVAREGGAVVITQTSDGVQAETVKPLNYCAASTRGNDIVIHNANNPGEELLCVDFRDLTPTGASADAVRENLNKNYLFGSPGISFTASLTDAFSRLRVSEPVTLFDSKNLTSEGALLWDKIETGAGSAVTFSIPETTLTCGDVAGGQVVRQSRRYITYQPGKSHLVMITGRLTTNAAQTGYKFRLGFFDDEADNGGIDGNGHFFEMDENAAIGIVQRSGRTGAQVDERIEQADWNGDRLDGSGPSGIDFSDGNYSWANENLFFRTAEWLSVGDVRMGVIIDEVFITCHTFRQAGLLTLPYMNRPTLPVRYEITRVTGGAAASMTQVCATVISEGGFNQLGHTIYASRGNTATSVDATNLEPVLSIRLDSSYNRATLIPRTVTLLTTTGGDVEWELMLFQDPDGSELTDETWAATPPPNSLIEMDTAATAVDRTKAEVIIAGGYFSGNQTSPPISIDTDIFLTSNIAGTSDILVLAARSLSGSKNILGGIQYLITE